MIHTEHQKSYHTNNNPMRQLSCTSGQCYYASQTNNYHSFHDHLIIWYIFASVLPYRFVDPTVQILTGKNRSGLWHPVNSWLILSLLLRLSSFLYDSNCHIISYMTWWSSEAIEERRRIHLFTKYIQNRSVAQFPEWLMIVVMLIMMIVVCFVQGWWSSSWKERVEKRKRGERFQCEKQIDLTGLTASTASWWWLSMVIMITFDDQKEKRDFVQSEKKSHHHHLIQVTSWWV